MENSFYRNVLVIFDMGGVLTHHGHTFASVAHALGINESDFFRIAGKGWDRLVCGKIDSHLFWKKLSQKLKGNISPDLFNRYFYPQINQAVLEMIKRLQRTHYKVVCGTNTIADHYQIHVHRGDYDIFDQIYASHLIGLAKPDPQFYHYILKKEKTIPGNTVFIDDMMENIQSAREIGIQAVHFTDSQSLQEDLEKLKLFNGAS